MAKVSKIKQLETITSYDISRMSKNELVDLLTSTSKSITQRIRNLKKSGVASPYLNKRNANGLALPREIKKTTAQRMSKQQLKKEIVNLALTQRASTSSTRGAKKFVRDFKEKTGVEYSSLTKDDWSNIRKYIEESGGAYSSEEIISTYDEIENDENIIEKLKKAEEQKIEEDKTSIAELLKKSGFDL